MNNYHSPCVSVCSLETASDGTEYCIGCKRTSEEVFSWLSYDEKTRKNLLKEIKERNYD